MTTHEARFYDRLPDSKVLCTLCPHDCHIPDGARGACGVRYNRGGMLYTLVYDRLVAREVNPIEKKPLFHFHVPSPIPSPPSAATCAARSARTGRSRSGPRIICPSMSLPGRTSLPSPSAHSSPISIG